MLEFLQVMLVVLLPSILTVAWFVWRAMPLNGRTESSV